MFGALAGYDTGLIWLNLICLLTVSFMVSFMPFPTVLLGACSSATDQLPVVLYAVSMTVTSLALTVTWQYAIRRRLLADDLGPASSGKSPDGHSSHSESSRGRSAPPSAASARPRCSGSSCCRRRGSCCVHGDRRRSLRSETARRGPLAAVIPGLGHSDSRRMARE